MGLVIAAAGIAVFSVFAREKRQNSKGITRGRRGQVGRSLSTHTLSPSRVPVYCCFLSLEGWTHDFRNEGLYLYLYISTSISISLLYISISISFYISIYMSVTTCIYLYFIFIKKGGGLSLPKDPWIRLCIPKGYFLVFFKPFSHSKLMI